MWGGVTPEQAQWAAYYASQQAQGIVLTPEQQQWANWHYQQQGQQAYQQPAQQAYQQPAYQQPAYHQPAHASYQQPQAAYPSPQAPYQQVREAYPQDQAQPYHQGSQSSLQVPGAAAGAQSGFFVGLQSSAGYASAPLVGVGTQSFAAYDPMLMAAFGTQSTASASPGFVSSGGKDKKDKKDKKDSKKDKKKKKKPVKIQLTGQLKLKVLEAKNLKAMDANGKSDPYTVLKLDGKTASKTKVKQKTLNPVWNEDIGAALNKVTKIDLVVYDKDLVADEVCGSVALSTADISSEPVDIWLDLKPQGRLHVIYSFAPTWTEDQVRMLTDEQCMGAMKFGVQLQKQKSSMVPLKSKSETRFFQLTSDEHTITWTGGRPLAHRVRIYDIREFRTGFTHPSFAKIAAEKKLDKQAGVAFTIVYGHNYKHINLIAPSPPYFQIWTRGLNYLLTRPKVVPSRLPQSLLEEYWKRADKNGDNSLSRQEIQSLLNHLNTNFPSHQVNSCFERAAAGARELNLEQFKNFYLMLTKRDEDVKALLQGLIKDKSQREYLTNHEFMEFLTQIQKVPGLTIDIVNNIIYEYEEDSAVSAQNNIGLAGFTNFLLSEFNDPVDPRRLKLHQDMRQPLSHYWINSSHNTYLLGDQLKGESSLEAYVRALQQGCRCVELDCWDGPDGEPIIYHGRTLTTKLKFKDVIDTIKKWAFVTTPYPLILSIENHCGAGQQAIMGVYMQTTFGDMMVKGLPDTSRKALPSPEELKGKILVKGGKLPFEANAKPEDVYEEDEDEDDPPPTQSQSAPAKKPKVSLSKDLSDCVVYCKTCGFKGFENASGKYWEMSSFAEAKANKLATSQTLNFIKYNQTQLSRIFPAGGRVDSSNYDPTTCWSAGCQIVALNYQTPDRPMQLNEIKFKVNGKSGYILKPGYMRGQSTQPTPAILIVKLISGQKLPKPVGSEKSGDLIDPYVEIEVPGAGKEKSKVRTKNGFNPQWQEQYQFNISDVESALLRLAVYDKENIGSDRFIGYWGAPVSALRPGYRHLYLQHGNGHPLGDATLFVFIGFK